MADQLPDFEFSDKSGTTTPFNGTVGTGWANVPSSASGKIQSFAVINPISNDPDNWIEITLDGGSTIYDRIYPSGYLHDLIKGDSIGQISIRAKTSGVAYKIILDREPA